MKKIYLALLIVLLSVAKVGAELNHEVYLPIVYSLDNSPTPIPTPTPPPGECPQFGYYTARTDNSRPMGFNVTPSCEIYYLVIEMRDSCGYTFTYTFDDTFPITNGHFSLTGQIYRDGTLSVWGDFTSPTEANGGYSMTRHDPYWVDPICTKTGLWWTIGVK